jgi:hypothetical protein
MTVKIIISSKKVLFAVPLKQIGLGPDLDLGQKKTSILVLFRPDPSQKQISVQVPEPKFSYRGRGRDRGPLCSSL